MTEQELLSRLRQSRPSGRTGLLFLAGVAIGGGLMYLLDPRTGNRRRAVAQDKIRSFTNTTGVVAGKTYRHLRNQLQGVIATVTEGLRQPVVVSDRKLLDRIRSTVGRTITHPHSVDFAIHEGRVTVRGALKPHEAGAVIQAIERIRGVRSVDNQILDAEVSSTTLQ